MSRILVIDDDELVCEMLASALRVEGFETVQALDGRKGIEAAQEHSPDLIVCDVRMPNLDGYATLTAIRKNPATATIPFIFLTGQGSKADIRQGMDLGADDFLAKPILIPELVGAIRTRLEKQQLARQETERRLNELRVSMSLSLPHEIRTPLSGIIGFAEVLRDDSAGLKPDEITEMATHILKSATRLGSLVENFLTYAQLEIIATGPNKRALVGKESTEMLNHLIQESAGKKAKAYNRTSDLRFNLCVAEAGLSNQSAKRIIEELVDNALKFSQNGTPVEITMKNRESYLSFSVKDHGAGMEKKHIDEIGAYRQFNRKSREQQGSGLGLAIVKRMTELYGGNFSIESEVGKGTTVTTEFPRAETR